MLKASWPKKLSRLNYDVDRAALRNVLGTPGAWKVPRAWKDDYGGRSSKRNEEILVYIHCRGLRLLVE